MLLQRNVQYGQPIYLPGGERWYVPPVGNIGYDDEFDDGSIAAAWNAVDVPSYANSWYEPSGVKGLSVSIPSGKGDMKLAGILKSFAELTPPVYIETALRHIGPDQKYPAAGLIFSDGAAYGSGVQVGFFAFQSSNYIHSSNWTNYNNRTSLQEHARHNGSVFDRIYLRLCWSDTNKFKFFYSMDGVVWIEPFSETSYTITPTYFGLCQSSFNNSTYPYVANFAYFRVRSGSPVNG